MNIVIKELYGSDNILTLTEKINQNFDQILLSSGGPIGPQGPSGAQGVAGPEGIRGSQWFGATGASGTINIPTDGVFRENDFRLEINGDVEYFDSGWVSLGINIAGPTGPAGPEGDGSISILSGLNQSNGTFGNQFTPQYTQLGNYLGKNFPNDKDDYDLGSVGYVNAGMDFVALGRGNNSLVLGRYATLFRNSATSAIGGTFSPPTGNLTMDKFPTSESNVPMFIISQNDYKNPSANSSFTNGIAIGLTKTHETAQYNANSSEYASKDMDYNDFANLSIQNRFFDFRLGAKGMITLDSVSGISNFRLGTRSARALNTSVQDVSTKLESQIYTEFKFNDSFVVNLSSGITSYGLGVIIRDEYKYNENKKIYTSNNDLRSNVSKSFISNNAYGFGDSNEIVLLNKTLLSTTTTGSSTDKGRVVNTYTDSINFDSNSQRFPFRIGQTVLNAKFIQGPNSQPTFPFSQSNLNVSYQGFGYDQALVYYSGVDGVNTSTDSINSESQQAGSLSGTIPNDNGLQTFLGYDILAPLNNQSGSRSMSRMGLFPGLFRQEKDNSGNYDTAGDPNKTNRKDKFFDVSHKMLPTGSMDLYGTVRLRQQEETNDGNQDGYVAINKKNGIITFEEPNLINAVPTFAVMSFPELASDKFSFFVTSGKPLGFTAIGATTTDWLPGGTASCGAFIGKGSNELKDYYICNGAVLADERDIISTGPFSKMKGMNVETTSSFILENGTVTTGGSVIYTINNNFSGINSETQNTFTVNSTTGAPTSEKLGDFASSRANLIPRSDPKWGYSVLAPSVADSGFRIVLPNYFGKVAKMVLPDSDFIIRAVSGNTLNATPTTGQEKDGGFRFYTTNNKYNSSWMMKGCFETIGFPYLDGSQMPKLKSAFDGAHIHPIKSRAMVFQSGGNLIDALGENGGQPDAVYYTGNPANTSSGNHNHVINFWTKDSLDYNLDYWYGETTGGQYSSNSNWIRSTITGSPNAVGQGFITPPFKGTYMAINLKGVRNPVRNSIIKDFHYIAGVPRCSSPTVSSKPDMSWWSYLGTPRVSSEESKYTTTGHIYNNFSNRMTSSGFQGAYKLNAYEFGFKSMNRNDDTMHPYTYFNSQDRFAAGPLDYNNTLYSETSWQKHNLDLYRNSINKNTEFDTNLT